MWCKLYAAQMWHTRACFSLVIPASLQNPPNRLDRIRLGRRLVLAVALDAGEAEGHAAGVLRALLDVAEGDLDDQLGTDVDGPGVGADRQLLELFRLPGEALVGQ